MIDLDELWQPENERDAARLRYQGGPLSIAENAIAGDYVRLLDAVWRVRVGMIEHSWPYLVENAQYAEHAAHNLARLVAYWSQQPDEPADPRQPRPPATRLDPERMVRHIQTRGTHQWSGKRIVQQLHPIPDGWEDVPEAVARQSLETITCPVCGATSTHPMDIRTGWCGRCHEFTSIGTDQIDTRRPDLRVLRPGAIMQTEGNGDDHASE